MSKVLLKALGSLGSAIGVIADIGGAVGAICIFCMVLMVACNVIMRYLFDSPLFFVDEVAGYQMVLLVSIMLAYTLKKGTHIRIDVVIRRLPKKTQDILEVVTLTIGVALFAILAWLGWSLCLDSWRMKAFSPGVLRTPLYLVHFLLPLGFTLIGLQMIVHISKTTKTILTSSEKGQKTE